MSEPPNASVQSEIVSALAQNQRYVFYLNAIGILVGAAFCLAGFILALLGASGSIDWVVKSADVSSRLTNATPGALFAVLGACVMWRYKPELHDYVRWDGDTARIVRGNVNPKWGEINIGEKHHSDSVVKSEIPPRP